MHPLIRNVLLVAVATLALAAPVRAQFALIDDARVIVKYKTASTLLKEGITAEDKPAALAKAMSERTGIAFRAGASVADRTHVLLATGFTSEQLVVRLAADSPLDLEGCGFRGVATVTEQAAEGAQPAAEHAHLGCDEWRHVAAAALVAIELELEALVRRQVIPTLRELDEIRHGCLPEY